MRFGASAGATSASLGKCPKPLTQFRGSAYSGNTLWDGFPSSSSPALGRYGTNNAYAALVAALAVVSAAAYILGRKAMRNRSQPAPVTNVTRPA